MNRDQLQDQLARRIAQHLPREPELPADISARLAHARSMALARQREVVAVSSRTAALAPWWLRHMWFVVTLGALLLFGALATLLSEEEAAAMSTGWAYHSEAEAGGPALEGLE